MGQVTSALAECIHRAAISRAAYIYELEAPRQEVSKLDKEVVLLSPWYC